MVWTSANGPNCPVSPEDRGEEPSSTLDATALADRIAVTPSYSSYDMRVSLYRIDADPNTAVKDCKVFLVAEKSRDLILAALRAFSLSRPHSKSPALDWKLDRPECPRCKGQGRVGVMACNDCGATGVKLPSQHHHTGE